MPGQVLSLHFNTINSIIKTQVDTSWKSVAFRTAELKSKGHYKCCHQIFSTHRLLSTVISDNPYDVDQAKLIGQTIRLIHYGSLLALKKSFCIVPTFSVDRGYQHYYQQIFLE